jgi:GTP:adenosylcobinamide-phosphate guanylyltransferase
MTVTTLVLAGSRPGPDPLTARTGLSSKALLPVGGRPMLAHVLAALGGVGRIVVVAQDTEPLARAVAADVEWRTSQGGIADAVLSELDRVDGPLLVTTADNVLLTPAMVAQFLRAAGSADVAVGLVERRALEAAGLSSERTWLTFRGGQWSGANLFYLGGPQVAPLVKFWKAIEQDRKKRWRIVGAFGPGLLLGAALRLIDIHTFARRAARRFGLTARIVPMEAAEACIDADKPADIPVIEEILARRQASAASTAASASASSSA